MARARDILRHRLARRGITADGAVIVASFVRPPVPPEWLDATVRSSLSFAKHSATAAASVASARSVAIARRVLKTMVITKLSCVGSVGLGLVVALGGVQTLAFQDKGEDILAAYQAGARPGAVGAPDPTAQPKRRPKTPFKVPNTYIERRTFTGFSQETGGQDASSPKPSTDDSRAEQERMARAIEMMQKRIDQLTNEISELKDQVKTSRARLEPIRRGPQQFGGGQPSTVPPTPAKKGDSTGDTKGPHYIYFNGAVTVVSPDGAKGATYDPGSGISTRLQFPAVRGVQREIVSSSRLFNFQSPERPLPPVQNASQPWLFALDLDRADKVTRIGAFNVQTGEWVDQEVGEPVNHTSVGIVSPGRALIMRPRIYAFSGRAKRWGVVEIAPGSKWSQITPTGPLWIEKDGLLYVFNDATGNWDDVYAHAIGGEPGKPPK
jgi:hypothetical protein